MTTILMEHQTKLDNLRADYARCEVDILRTEAGLIKLDKFSLKWHQAYRNLNNLCSHRSKLLSSIADLVKDIGKLPIHVF